MKKFLVRILALILIFSLSLQVIPARAEAGAKLSPNIPQSYLYQAERPIAQEVLLVGRPAYSPPSAEVIAQTKAQVQSFNCATVTDVLQIECEALVALYNSTNGAGWTDRTNWLTGTTVGSWSGVTVFSGYVTALNLGYNQLSGTIPVALKNLSAVTYINLWNNALSGTIPSELGNLANLGSLDLSYNQLSGSIPAGLFMLTNLESLYLNGNELTGTIPTEVASSSKLKNLLLNSNKLNGTIPIALGSLTKLYNLFLDSNQLTGTIPSELCNLSSLYTLTLNFNQLSGSIPTALGALLNLEHLYLDHNQLSGGIPTSLPYKLQHLHLDHNQLTGAIPAEVGYISNLWYLRLDSNQLTGSIPSNLGNLHLNELLLGSNQLTGEIPTELGNMPHPLIFDLSLNMLTGAVPDSLVNLTSLTSLDLGYNHLTVPAPEPLASFLALKDPDWSLTQALAADIPGDSGGTLLSNDGNTEISIPPDAVTDTVTFLFDPQPAPSQELGELSFAGNSFALTAMLGGIPITSFAAAITLTLHYDPASLGTIPEDTLTLFYWDAGQSTWVDAVTTCTGGGYTRNLEDDWLSVPICHLSEFALLSQPIFKTFLPLTLR